MLKRDRNGIDFSRMEDKAASLLDCGKLQPAKRILQKMLEADSNNVAAHFHLARVFRRTGDYERALYHARRTIRLNPHERNAYLNLGLSHEVLGRWRLAVSNYRKELSKNPDSPETLWNLGNLWFERRQWRKAAAYLHRCFRIRCKTKEAADKLGACYAKLGEAGPYEQVFADYVRMFPADVWGHANLGRAHLRTRHYKQAFLRLRRAVELGDRRALNDLEDALVQLRISGVLRNGHTGGLPQLPIPQGP